jgi:hypothetical protein
MSSVADAADRVGAAVRTTDRDANADRLLRALVGRAETDTAPTAYFGGDETSLGFMSWCATGSGWLERCRVMMRFQPAESGMELTAALSTGDTIILFHGLNAGEFRYLRSADRGGTWFRVWGAGVDVPLGIGLLLDRDTVIVRIGERR